MKLFIITSGASSWMRSVQTRATVTVRCSIITHSHCSARVF